MKTGEPTPSLDFWALIVMLWVYIYKHCTHFCSSWALIVMLGVFVYYLLEIYPLWQLLYGQFMSVIVLLSENGATHATSNSVLTNAVISSGWCMGISNVNIPSLLTFCHASICLLYLGEYTCLLCFIWKWHLFFLLYFLMHLFLSCFNLGNVHVSFA